QALQRRQAHAGVRIFAHELRQRLLEIAVVAARDRDAAHRGVLVLPLRFEQQLRESHHISLCRMRKPAMYSPIIMPRLVKMNTNSVRETRFFHQPFQSITSSRSDSKSATRGRCSHISAAAAIAPDGTSGRNGLSGATTNAVNTVSGWPPPSAAPSAA